MGQGRRGDNEATCFHLLFVVVPVIVGAAVEAVARRHPLLLHQTLEAKACATVGVAHDLDQTGHYTAHVSVLRLWREEKKKL